MLLVVLLAKTIVGAFGVLRIINTPTYSNVKGYKLQTRLCHHCNVDFGTPQLECSFDHMLRVDGIVHDDKVNLSSVRGFVGQ
jgi:tRNA A37 threonylcarbamoyladenosine biosynthesis protein TsaE